MDPPETKKMTHSPGIASSLAQSYKLGEMIQEEKNKEKICKFDFL